MRGRMDKSITDKIIKEYMARFSAESEQAPPEPGELLFDLLETFTSQAHTPVTFRPAEEEVQDPLYAKEGIDAQDFGGGYCLPEMQTVWQKYLARKDGIAEREANRLEQEMLLVISREFLSGAGVDTHRSFTSLAAAEDYYIEQLSALPGSEAVELKNALESLKH